jgi:hypothetical protein
VKVCPNTAVAGKLDGELEFVIEKEGRTPDVIGVFGEVTEALVASPTALVLPRIAGGQLSYEGKVLLWNRENVKTHWSVVDCPPILDVRLSPSDGDLSKWNGRIAIKGGAVEAPKQAKHVKVCLLGKTSSYESRLEVEVSILPKVD